MTSDLAGFDRMTATTGDGAMRGATLRVSTHPLALGISLSFAADELGEEVGAVLEGEFDVDAAGEHYRLSAGQVIVIPSGEPRRYEGRSARGVLYRVVVNKYAEHSE
jgi:quercetin dioxygenase-like cupin family protein